MKIAMLAKRRGRGTQAPIGIVSEIKFEDDVVDAVGGYTTTATNITYIEDGGVGKSGVFNGTTSVVRVDNSINTTFESNKPFSISLLYNKNAAGEQFIVTADTWADRGFSFAYDGSVTLTMILLNGGTKTFKGTITALTLSQWYSVIITFDGAVFNFYIDGVLASMSAPTGTNTGMGTILAELAFGMNERGTKDLNGQMDCIRVWSRELPVEECLDIATKELAGIDINP